MRDNERRSAIILSVIGVVAGTSRSSVSYRRIAGDSAEPDECI